MSKAFVHIADDIFKPSSPIPGMLTSVGKGFSEFAKTLGSGGFIANLKRISTDIGNLTSKGWQDVAILALLGGGAARGIMGGLRFAGGAATDALIAGALRASPYAPAAAALAPMPLNVGEDERYRQAHPGWAPGQPKDPNWNPPARPAQTLVQPNERGLPMLGPGKALLLGPEGRSHGSTGHGRPGGRHMVPGAAQTGAAGPGTPWNHQLMTPEHHPYRYRGTLSVGGDKFSYVTGGHGRGSAPPGDYPIEGYRGGPLAGGEGRFLLGDFHYDPQAHAQRGYIRIHATRSEDIDRAVTSGCFGVPPSQWPQLKADLKAQLAAHGGNLVMHVAPDGSATIGSPHSAQKKLLVNGKVVHRADPSMVTSATRSPDPSMITKRAGTPSVRHHGDLLNRHRESLASARGPASPVEVHDHTGGAVNITVAQ
jgi:hypothetical protein